MPGQYDATDPNSDFMTPFKTHRTGASVDGTDHAAVEEEIDLSKSISAARNEIAVILDRQTGTDGADVSLYHRPGDDSDYTGMALIETVSAANEERVRFKDLLAGYYKILVEASDTATPATFDVYESHSNEKTSWNNE